MSKLSEIPVVIEQETLPVKTPSLPAEITKSLLEEKRPKDVAEIELSLFENCNIKCDFCFLDTKSTEHMSLQDMFSKIPIIEEFLKERAGCAQMLQVNFLGGELFQDKLIDQGYLAYYYAMAYRISELAEKYGFIGYRVIWVSNLLFANKEAVKEHIDALRAEGIDNHLIISYDFDGRPMSNRYRKNLEWFGPEYIISLSLVGTIPSIIEFMKDRDEYFKNELYGKYEAYFDSYIPEHGYDDLMPSDSLMYEWYKFMADTYPKLKPVSNLIEKAENAMKCLSLNKITIFPDNTTSNCRWHRYVQDDFNTEYNVHDNAGMMQTYIDEEGCLSCEYFQKCGLRCFVQADWRNRDRDMQNPKCPMKAFFNYITKGIDYSAGNTDHTGGPEADST